VKKDVNSRSLRAVEEDMSGEVPAYTLNLMGPFRLLRPDGARIEVTSKRGVALIAMLAMAAEGERTRDWLQDRLWSQRQRPQAQSSLRRELTNLRRSLNHRQPPLLICEHQRVKLDLGQLRIDARPASDDLLASVGALAAGEFLEGFDLAGEEAFEEWLREQRSAQRARADAAAGSGSVAGRGPGGSTRVMAVVSMAIIDEEGGVRLPRNAARSRLCHRLSAAQRGRNRLAPQRSTPAVSHRR
jgi:hypothetical protein